MIQKDTYEKKLGTGQFPMHMHLGAAVDGLVDQLHALCPGVALHLCVVAAAFSVAGKRPRTQHERFEHKLDGA